MLKSEMRESYERRGSHWKASSVVVMRDSVTSREIRPWVCQRKIKGKMVRERERVCVCFFLKYLNPVCYSSTQWYEFISTQNICHNINLFISTSFSTKQKFGGPSASFLNALKSLNQKLLFLDE